MQSLSSLRFGLLLAATLCLPRAVTAAETPAATAGIGPSFQGPV